MVYLQIDILNLEYINNFMGTFSNTFRGLYYNPTSTGDLPIISGEEMYYLYNRTYEISSLVNPNNSQTTTFLEYSDNINFINSTTISGNTISGSTNIEVDFIIPSQTPDDYYYRVLATNIEGTTTGSTQPYTVYPGIGTDLVDYSTLLDDGIATMTGTTYYIDPSAETNGNGLSSETPYDSWTRLATLGGGNKYLQKRGTTYQAATGIFRGFNGACYMGVYGEGIDYAYIIAGTNSNSTFIGTNYRLIIEGYDIKGYRATIDGTQAGMGIGLGATSSASTMNHIIYNNNIHDFEEGIGAYVDDGYFRGVYILHNDIYDIRLDGIYPTSATDIEIAYNYMYNLNTAWFINEDDGTSSGDGIQIGFGNGTFPTIHLEASIHHNTIDRSTTRNKFGIIWNEQENGETVMCYNNHLICPDYSIDTDHPVSAIYTSLSNGATDDDICNTEIYNNLFEGGNYGIRNYTRASTKIHHNIFIDLYIAVAAGGGLNIEVYNNIFKDYTSVALGMGSNPRVYSKNNVFRTSTAAAYAYASISGMAESDYNNFFGTRINVSAYGLTEWKAEQTFDDNSIDTDPLHINYNINDFRILNSSPLINSGANVGLTSDIMGNNIPQGLGYDIGIYEFVFIDGFYLPYSQTFNNNELPSGWTTQVEGVQDQWWWVNSSESGGNNAGEMRSAWLQNTGVTRLVMPPFNTINITKLNLKFIHFFDAFGSGVIIKIQSSSDAITWTDETWQIASSTSNIGPALVDTSIDSNLNQLSTFISFTISGNLFKYDFWYIDDVILTISQI